MADRIFELYEGGTGTPGVIEEARARVDWLVARIGRSPVLDVGCSQGLLPVLLARKGLRVTGVESNAESVECAKQRLAQESEAVKGLVTLHHADIVDWKDDAPGYATIVLALLLDAPETAGVLLESALRHAAPDADVFIQANLGRRTPNGPPGFMPSEILQAVESFIGVNRIEFSPQRIYLQGRRTDGKSEPYPRDEALLRQLERASREKDDMLLAEVARYQEWSQRLKQEKQELLSEPSEGSNEPNWRKLAVERRLMVARSRKTVAFLESEIDACNKKLEAKQETILQLQERLRIARGGATGNE